MTATPLRWVPPLLALLLATANLATAKPTADEKPRHAGTRGGGGVVGVDGGPDDAWAFGSDHDAILGSYAAREFHSLSPEESKERLGKLVDRMDVDGDGLVTEEELAAWIRLTQRRWLHEDVEQRWRDPNGDGRLSWDEYKNATYGGLSFETADAYSRLLARDKRRFDAAASGVSGGTAAAGGGELSRGEFAAFLHPSSFGHMSDVVVTETIEDVDKDGDGAIDLEEYIADMYHPAGPADTPEPEWVETERQQFRRFRDSDGDGRMGREEVRAWLLPVGYEHALAEARHLVGEADDGDEDGKLSKEEVLAKWSVFVGSQATNYGDDLNRRGNAPALARTSRTRRPPSPSWPVTEGRSKRRLFVASSSSSAYEGYRHCGTRGGGRAGERARPPLSPPSGDVDAPHQALICGRVYLGEAQHLVLDRTVTGVGRERESNSGGRALSTASEMPLQQQPPFAAKWRCRHHGACARLGAR